MRFLIPFLLFWAVPAAWAQDSTCDNLNEVAWMEGTWEVQSDTRRTVEQWSRITEQTMEGEGRVFRVDTGTQVGSETLRLVEMGGEVFYLAKTGGNALPIAFRLTSCSSKSATFENPDHDFPQRLVYRNPSADSLHVDVSDLDGNGFRLEFVRGSF